MQAQSLKPNWALNDLCKVIVGFRNFTTHATRSKYISFAIAEQPQMCELLLRLARGRLSSEALQKYPDVLWEQLIDYGFLRPLERLNVRGHCRQFIDVFNRSRFRSIAYKGRRYRPNSLVFMAFYSQKENGYLHESIVLPAWSPEFSSKVLDILTRGFDRCAFERWPAPLKKRLCEHGLITPADRLPYREEMLCEHGRLSTALIDELPDFYRSELALIEAEASRYSLNPAIFRSAAEIPAEERAQIPNLAWALSCRPSVWVRDPVKDVLSMRWLSAEQLQLLDALAAGRLSVDQLDRKNLALFVYGGILYDHETLRMRREAWSRRLEALGGQLAKDECITFENVLSPLELAIARKYLRFMKEKKYLLYDRANGSTRQRYWCHRDEFAFYLQGQVCAQLNRVLRKPVKPGHNALTVYQAGATLPRHQDDVLAFSWVMSLPIETHPESSKQQAWPLYVETRAGARKALLRPGEGHLIDPQMPHWREVLRDGSLSILFFWFVPKEFRGYVNGSWID